MFGFQFRSPGPRCLLHGNLSRRCMVKDLNMYSAEDDFSLDVKIFIRNVNLNGYKHSYISRFKQCSILKVSNGEMTSCITSLQDLRKKTWLSIRYFRKEWVVTFSPACVDFSVGHPCAKNRCSHICLVGSHGQAQCSCPVDKFLNEDNFTCGG